MLLKIWRGEHFSLPNQHKLQVLFPVEDLQTNQSSKTLEENKIPLIVSAISSVFHGATLQVFRWEVKAFQWELAAIINTQAKEHDSDKLHQWALLLPTNQSEWPIYSLPNDQYQSGTGHFATGGRCPGIRVNYRRYDRFSSLPVAFELPVDTLYVLGHLLPI